MSEKQNATSVISNTNRKIKLRNQKVILDLNVTNVINRQDQKKHKGKYVNQFTSSYQGKVYEWK